MTHPQKAQQLPLEENWSRDLAENAIWNDTDSFTV